MEFAMDKVVDAVGGGDDEGDALDAGDVVALEDGEALADGVKDLEDGNLHAVIGGGDLLGEGLGAVFAEDAFGEHSTDVGADFVDLGVALPAQAAFEDANELEGDKDEEGGEAGDEIKACSTGDADGGDNPDGGGTGEAEDSVLGVEDEAGAEEADALDDVGGDLAAAGRGFAGDGYAHDGEERGAHADEDVGAEAGVFVPPFALEADGSAHGAGHEKTLDGGSGEDPLLEDGEVDAAGVGHLVRILLGWGWRDGGCRGWVGCEYEIASLLNKTARVTRHAGS